jgi:outer membrane receptor for ferrienterochelin and colicins
MRLDHHQEHGVITAPRLATKWDLSDRTTLRLNGGTGFRVVNVFTEDHAALTGSREVVFEEALDPERSYSITGSLRQIIPFGTNPLTIELDGFYTRFSNKIIPDYDRDPDLIVYENLDGWSVTRGASINLTQNFTAVPLTYSAGLTLMDVYGVEGGRRTPVTYAPDYLGTLGATYTIRDADLRFDYEMRLVGPKRMPASYGAFDRPLESPVFTTHDLKVAHELTSVNGLRGTGIEVYLSAENVFDFTQPTPLVAASDPFGEEFDTVYTWGPVLGRTVSFGIRLTMR